MGERGKNLTREREAGSRHASPAAAGKSRGQARPLPARALLEGVRIEGPTAPEVLQLQRLLGNQRTTGFLADRPWIRDGGQERRGLLFPSQGVVQRDWDPEDVRELLTEKAVGVRAELVAGKYAIHKYDEMNYMRKIGDVESEGSPLGYHCRIHKWIGIKADEAPVAAAATIVHEVQHVRQRAEEEAQTRAKLDVVTKEIEAHLREEEFRKAHGAPPKEPEYRTASDEIDREAIEEDVRRKYDPKGVGRYYPAGHPKAGEPLSKQDLMHFHNLATNDREVKIWE